MFGSLRTFELIKIFVVFIFDLSINSYIIDCGVFFIPRFLLQYKQRVEVPYKLVSKRSWSLSWIWVSSDSWQDSYHQLGNHVCWIICYIDLLNFDSTMCYHILDKVHLNINMLGPFMVYLIFGKMYQTLAITKSIVFFDGIPNFPTRPRSQTTSFTTYVVAMYSTSVIDKGTINYSVSF